METDHIEVVVDKRGTVQIRGFASDEEAAKAAKQLGISGHYPALQVDDLSPDKLEKIVGRARILGFAVVETGEAASAADEGPLLPAVEADTPRRGFPKRALAWIVIIAVVALGAVVVRDHLQRDYSPVPTLSAAVDLVRNPPPRASGLASLLNPPDAQYISFEARDWMGLAGTSAILQGHYLKLRRLKAGSIERLLGDRSSGVLEFRIDAWQSDVAAIHVDEILRDGIETGEADLTMEVYPLDVTNAPQGYAAGDDIEFDRKKTFENLERFTVAGRLQRTERGLRIVSDRFNVALDEEIDPGLRAVIEDRLGTPAENSGGGEGPVYYLSFTEAYPWDTEEGPGWRQLYEEIGVARLDGVLTGGLYLNNKREIES